MGSTSLLFSPVGGAAAGDESIFARNSDGQQLLTKNYTSLDKARPGILSNWQCSLPQANRAGSLEILGNFYKVVSLSGTSLVSVAHGRVGINEAVPLDHSFRS